MLQDFMPLGQSLSKVVVSWAADQHVGSSSLHLGHVHYLSAVYLAQHRGRKHHLHIGSVTCNTGLTLKAFYEILLWTPMVLL